MPTTTRSSSPPTANRFSSRADISRGGCPLGPLIVLEGMPGAGKTTAAQLLAAEGRQVVGEYTTPAGETIPLADHPGVEDDDAHQHNWLTKHHQITNARRTGPVYADRDWLSALAYAYTLTDHNPALLEARCAWGARNLAAGTLSLASVYVVFTLDPAISVHRRAHRLAPGHPWNNPDRLHRLADFYHDPPAAVAATNPDLATQLAHRPWRYLTGTSIAATVRLLRDLAHRP